MPIHAERDIVMSNLCGWYCIEWMHISSNSFHLLMGAH